MKTLMILPIALVLFAASCKKSDDLPAPARKNDLIQHNLQDDYYPGTSTVGQAQTTASDKGGLCAAMRQIGIRENGQDLFGPDPNLHAGNGTPIRLPYDNALITTSPIPTRKDGDLPPRRPNTWDKAPGPISAY